MINASLKTIGQSQCCHLFKKIFEKIVADSVIDFLVDHDILCSKQFGFRKRHSTTHALTLYLPVFLKWNMVFKSSYNTEYKSFSILLIYNNVQSALNCIKFLV